MGVLTKLGLRRSIVWESPTILDQLIESPIQTLVYHLYMVLLWVRGSPIRAPGNKPPIKVVFLSDTHDEVVGDVPDGDLLVHCGDTSSVGTAAAIQRQVDWLDSLPHQHKVLVCGNHDSWFDINSRAEEDTLAKRQVNLRGIHYLERSHVTLAFKGGRKLTIYGAPDLPACGGPENAFQYSRDSPPWSGLVPLDTDILVTHTPPLYHRDLKLGCGGLLAELWRIRPAVHAFGHVHCGRGVQPAFWDDCQAAYERVMACDRLGVFRGCLPSEGWLDALQVLAYGLRSVAWQWVMMGGSRSGGAGGSLLVNAGMQDGTKGRLLRGAVPVTVEL